MPHEGPLCVSLEPLSGKILSIAATWQRVAARAADRHYALTPEWLGAWWEATVDRDELWCVRISEGDGADVAVGLLERGIGGRWRFAGGDVSPQRGLLCARGAEDAVWRAFWSSGLRYLPRAAECEAQGLAAWLPIPRRAQRWEQLTFGMVLPGSFDEYLRERRPGTRRALKTKLRRLDKAGGSVAVVPVVRRAEALERFLELHTRNAAAKGERHAQIDRRLTRLLAAVRPSSDVRLRLLELRVGDVVRGVTVRLDHAGTAYFYNAGVDPEWSRLSPGICLELASIRDAIGLGSRRFDLGPGDWRYKRDLGGVAERRVRVVVPSRSPRGLVLLLARRAHGRWR